MPEYITKPLWDCELNNPAHKQCLCRLILTQCINSLCAFILDKQWQSLTPPHTFKARQKYRSWQLDKRERGRLAMVIVGRGVILRTALWFSVMSEYASYSQRQRDVCVFKLVLGYVKLIHCAQAIFKMPIEELRSFTSLNNVKILWYRCLCEMYQTCWFWLT